MKKVYKAIKQGDEYTIGHMAKRREGLEWQQQFLLM